MCNNKRQSSSPICIERKHANAGGAFDCDGVIVPQLAKVSSDLDEIFSLLRFSAPQRHQTKLSDWSLSIHSKQLEPQQPPHHHHRHPFSPTADS